MKLEWTDGYGYSSGLLGFVERLGLGLGLGLPPGRRKSLKVTACQQRAWAGRKGDVGYRWIPFPPSAWITEERLWLRSITLRLCCCALLFAAEERVLKLHFLDFTKSSQSPPFILILDLYDTSSR